MPTFGNHPALDNSGRQLSQLSHALARVDPSRELARWFDNAPHDGDNAPRSHRVTGDAMPKPNPQDAELLLKLYELRRDPEMRRARAFILSEFNVTDWEEIRPQWMTGNDLDRHIRMVSSYWEMVAAFVNRGMVDEDLFFDTHGEALVVWNRLKAIVPAARKQIRPTWLWNLERLARRQEQWRQRSYKTAAKVIEAGSKLKPAKRS